MTRCCVAILLFCSSALHAGPHADAVNAALRDCQTLQPTIQPYVRYLSLYNLPLEERKSFLNVLAFHVNSISREFDLVKPRLVTPDLAAIQLYDYGWEYETWELLAKVDPYFHVQAKVVEPVVLIVADCRVVNSQSQEIAFLKAGQQIALYGKQISGWHTIRFAINNQITYGWIRSSAGRVKRGNVGQVIATAAPWLPTTIHHLEAITHSKAPIVRADWFVTYSAIQKDRKPGYYDWLGLGNKRADFEKLVALDRKASQRVRREIAAIVDKSVVALNNRQIFRFQTLTGGYWESRDTKNNLGKRNAIRQLNGDFQWDAEEIYGVLPNGLFCFFLSDGDGNRQDTAPDFIASDFTSPNPDRRVHVGLSCIRCHTEGLRPIDDWARKAYAPPDQLVAVDPFKYKRLKQLYLAPLDRWIDGDRRFYAAALKECNGQTPADNARAYATVWATYYDEPVTLETAAVEVGCTPDGLRAAIRAYPSPDPVLFGLGKAKSIPIRREHWEEVYVLAQKYLK